MTTLIREQTLPIDINNAWKFFSNPENLKTITPDYMGFDIIGEYDSNIYPGMIITYKVSPLLNIPLTWVTEIAHVNKPFYFVDVQISGPYKLWYHQHIFAENGKNTNMKDIVHFSAPLGWIGKLAERTMINRKVNEIFDYRNEKLKTLFG